MILYLAFLVSCSPVDETDSGLIVEPKAFSNSEIKSLRSHWPLPDVPLDTTNSYGDDPYAQHLGQYLFYDTRFSENGEVACATCHDPALGWSDGKQVADTLIPVNRHTPSLWNAGYLRWSFWDGRCDSLWCQALEPFESEAEMGGDRMGIVHAVVGDAELSAAYLDVFGNLPDVSDASRFPAHARPGEAEHPFAQAWSDMRPDDRAVVNGFFANIGKAIAAFERLVVSRESPFDSFAEALLTSPSEGKGLDSISDAAARGLKLFLGEGQCHFCHSGPNFTNQEFANVGVGSRAWLDDGDRGRIEGVLQVRDNTFNGSGVFSDDPEMGTIKLNYLNIGNEQEGQFKVPTLRNVSTHPPYFHGGHAETLEDVVAHYGDPTLEIPEFGHREDLLVNVTLDEDELADLVAFLESLTSGSTDESLRSQPASPLLDE